MMASQHVSPILEMLIGMNIPLRFMALALPWFLTACGRFVNSVLGSTRSTSHDMIITMGGDLEMAPHVFEISLSVMETKATVPP